MGIASRRAVELEPAVKLSLDLFPPFFDSATLHSSLQNDSTPESNPKRLNQTLHLNFIKVYKGGQPVYPCKRVQKLQVTI